MIGDSPALTFLSACLYLDGDPEDPRRTWPSMDGWYAVIKLANEHLLGPALYRSLRRRGWYFRAPAEVRDYLELIARQNRTRNRVLRKQAMEIVAALNRAGIEPMILKGGIVLFDSHTPNLSASTRMMRDLDIMVPSLVCTRAISSLRNLGYEILDQYPVGHHAFAEFTRPGAPAAVDLHIELVDPSYVLSADEMWSRARALDISGSRLRLPAPNDRMLHHLLHAQVHHLGNFYRGELQLDRLYEFAVLAVDSAADLDWRHLESRLTSHRLVSPLHSYLIAARQLFGVPWPLAAQPTLPARLHYERCRWQQRWPVLRSVGVPWGNFRGAFAWHRMKAFYGSRGWLPLWQLRHAWQFVRQTPPRQVFQRLFRA